jgi:hypothetical protein
MKRGPKILAAIIPIVIPLALAPRPQQNPPVRPEQTIEAHLPVPAEVASILHRACYDCHSNETRWPWYSRIPPMSFMIHRDVTRARARMNFSEWPTGRERYASSLLLAMCTDLRSGAMPKRGYTFLHPGARLSAEEVNRVCEWSTAEARQLVAALRQRAKSVR